MPARAIQGGYWQASCPNCPWTSRDLPFPTEARALHALKLHSVLCRVMAVGEFLVPEDRSEK